MGSGPAPAVNERVNGRVDAFRPLDRQRERCGNQEHDSRAMVAAGRVRYWLGPCWVNAACSGRHSIGRAPGDGPPASFVRHLRTQAAFHHAREDWRALLLHPATLGLPEYNPEWYFQMTLHTLRGDCSERARNLAELLTMTTNDNKAQAYW